MQKSSFFKFDINVHTIKAVLLSICIILYVQSFEIQQCDIRIVTIVMTSLFFVCNSFKFLLSLLYLKIPGCKKAIEQRNQNIRTDITGCKRALYEQMFKCSFVHKGSVSGPSLLLHTRCILHRGGKGQCILFAPLRKKIISGEYTERPTSKKPFN